jgi:ribosomal protein L5
MMNDYCVDQLISDWQYGTVCRYKLTEMPIEIWQLNNLLTVTRPYLSFCKNKLVPAKTQDNKRIFNGSSIKCNIETDEKSSPLLSHVTPFKELVSKGKQDSCIIINESNASTIIKAYLNHVKLWGDNLDKITLHVTSGKLLSNSELYTSFYMALCCCGNQSPHTIKSRRAVSSFNVVKAAITGARSSLRNKNKLHFSYKWAYLAAELSMYQLESNIFTSEQSQCLGIDNVFIFPELDKFNYDLFEPIAGLDLALSYKCLILPLVLYPV